MTGSAIRRFLAKIEVDATSGCWIWTAASNPDGYGRFWVNGKLDYAHRYAHETFVAPIPDGLDIDHLCRNHSCCNPAHLEAVTRQTNLLRGDTLTKAHRDGVDCGFAACKNCQRHRRAS